MTVTAVPAGSRTSNRLTLVVTEVLEQTPFVKSFVLSEPSGAPLPAFVPGSHIVVDSGVRANAYSLTGSGLDPSSYTISVRRGLTGTGGSEAMHRLRTGDTVSVSRPRSAFAPVATARHHLLVAAGIGITPMLSHARAAEFWGRPASLVYSYRSGAGAHLEDVRALTGLTDLIECTRRQDFEDVIHRVLLDQVMGTHLYVCGPTDFMTYVLTAAEAHGWPADRLHSEPFGAAEPTTGEPFTVELSRSGRSLLVPAGNSLLEVLEAAGTAVPNMCRQGVCGECALPVLRGRIDHRDLYLTDDEKAAHDTVMCCVSRAHDDDLELDL